MKQHLDQFIGKITSNKAEAYVARVAEPFSQLPHLPESWRKFISQIVPVIAVLGLIFGAIQIVAEVWMLSLFVFSPTYIFSFNNAVSLIIGIVLQILAVLLLYRAIKPLQKRQYLGWQLLFWTAVINVSMIVADLILGNVLFGFLWFVIETFLIFYLLFEIKSYYMQSVS